MYMPDFPTQPCLQSHLNRVELSNVLPMHVELVIRLLMANEWLAWWVLPCQGQYLYLSRSDRIEVALYNSCFFGAGSRSVYESWEIDVVSVLLVPELGYSAVNGVPRS